MAGVQPTKFINYISQFKKLLVTRNNGIISQKFKIDSATDDNYYFSIVNSNNRLIDLTDRTFKIYGSIFDSKDQMHILFYSDKCTIEQNGQQMHFKIDTYTSQYMNIVKTNKIIDLTIVEIVNPDDEIPDEEQITQVILRDTAIAYKRPYIENQTPAEILQKVILTSNVPLTGVFGAGQDINLTIGSNGAAFGTGLTQTGDNQLVIGKYNEADNTKVFVIGNGSNDSERHNLVTIDYDGNVDLTSGNILTSGSISANAIYVGGQDLNNVVDDKLASTSAWVTETFETQTDATAAHNSLAQEIEGVDQKIDAVSAAVSSVTIPTNISYFNNDVGYLVPSSLNGYATQIWVNQQGFAYSNQLNAYALKSEVPTKVSDLTNDSGYITGYQAGTGIAINNGVISIDGELGKTYYADDTTLQLDTSTNTFSIKSLETKLAPGNAGIELTTVDGVTYISNTGEGGGGSGSDKIYSAGTGLSSVNVTSSNTQFFVNESWLATQIETATQDLQNLSAGTGLKIEDNIISISATYVVPSTLNDYATTATVQGIDERVSTIENAEYISSGDVDTKISAATTDMATTGWVTDQHYITSAEAPSTVYYAGEGLSLEDSTFILTATLSTMTNDAGFATTGYVNDQIDAIDYSAYATNTDLQAVSSEVSANTESINSITNAMNQKQDKAEMSAYALSASVYNKDEVDNISTALYNQITGATEGAASEQWVEDHFLSSLTSADIPSEFVDTTELATALEPYALSTDVTTAINAATSGKADLNSVYTKEEVYTYIETDVKINEATSGKLDKTDFDIVSTALSTAIDGKTTSAEVKEQIEAYGYQTAQDVANAISGKADTATVNEQFEATSTYIGTVSSNIEEDITSTYNNLTGKINTASTTLITQTDYLSGQIDNIKADYATSGYVTGQVNDLATGAVQTNTNNISQLSTDIETVSGKANINETNIGLVSSDLGILSGELDTTSTFISGKVNALSGQLTTASSTLTGQTFYLSGQLSTAQDDISTISSDLEDAVELVGSLSSTVLTFDDRITTISSNCDFVSGQVEIISGKVDDNTENIEAVSGIATANATNIGIISGDLNTVSGNLNTVSTNLDIVSGKVDVISSDYVTSGVLTAYVNNQFVAVSQLANDVGYITINDVPGGGGGGGQTYEAGTGIAIDEQNVISVTGMVTSTEFSDLCGVFSAAITGKADTSGVYSKTSADSTFLKIENYSAPTAYTAGTGLELDGTEFKLTAHIPTDAEMSGVVSNVLTASGVALTSDIPSAISDLTNDSGYITGITIDVQDVDTRQGQTSIMFDSNFNFNSQYITLNVNKIIQDNSIATTNDIPDTTSFVTSSDVNNQITAIVTSTYVGNFGFATTNYVTGAISGKADSSDIPVVSTYSAGTNISITPSGDNNFEVAFTGTIPSVEGLISASEASGIASAVTTGYLTGYTTSAQVSSIVEGYGYITGIENNALLSDIKTYTAGEGLKLEGTEFSVSAEWLTGQIINTANIDYISGLGFAQTSAIPTAVSDLTNDTGYITGITVWDTNYSDTVSITGFSIDTQWFDVQTSDNVANIYWKGLRIVDSEGNQSETRYAYFNSDFTVVNDGEEDTYISLATPIPLSTSQLTNDSGYITSSDLPAELSGSSTIDITDSVISLKNASDYIMSGDNVSKLTNDAGYITSIPTSYAQLSDIPSVEGLISASEASGIASAVTTGYLTDYYTKSEINTSTGAIDGRLTAIEDDYTTSAQVSAIASAYASEATPSVDTICGMLSSADTNTLTISKSSDKIVLSAAAGGGGTVNLIAGNRIRLTPVGNATRIDVLDYAISAANTASINVDWRNCSTTTEVGTIAYNYEGIRPVTVSFNSALPNGVSATVDSATSSVVFTALSASDVSNGNSIVSATIIADDAQEAVVQTTINAIGKITAEITGSNQTMSCNFSQSSAYTSAFTYGYNGTASESLNVSFINTPQGITATSSYANGTITVTLSGSTETIMSNGNRTVTVRMSANDSAITTFTIEVQVTGIVLKVPLSFTAVNGPATIKVFKTGSPDAVALSTSTDGGVTWTPYTIATSQYDQSQNITIQQGSTIMFKNGTNKWSTHPGGDQYIFAITGYVEADGNVQALVNFIQNAPDNCFAGLFNSCSGLVKAPSLLATQLGEHCYDKMFYHCTSLTAAPQLPATTLGILAYSYMFAGCTSLSSVTVNFTEWVQDNTNGFRYWRTQGWLNNVASTGTFHCPAGLDTTTRDMSHIPQNWTVVN